MAIETVWDGMTGDHPRREDMVNKEIHQLEKQCLCALATQPQAHKSFTKLMSAFRNLRSQIDSNDNLQDIYTNHYSYCMEIFGL